jgi:quercetin dioxygenase-like cupin family protein
MRSLAAVVVALLLVVGAPGFALAQEASPAADMEMMQGIALEVLAEGVIEQAPAGPAEIGFVRLTIAPGASIPVEPDPALAFVAVQSGTLTANLASPVQVTRVEVAGTPVAAQVSAAEATFPLGPGESAVFPPLVAGEVRNDSAEPVEVLAVFVGPPAGMMATPQPAATPMAEEAGMEGVTFEPLAFGVAEQMPAGPVRIAISRITLPAGIALPPDPPHSGPEVGIVEAGSFALQTAAGPPAQVVRAVAGLAATEAMPTMEATAPGQDVTVEAGDAFFIPLGSATGGAVVGDTELVALLAVIEPLAGAAAATPGP